MSTVDLAALVRTIEEDGHAHPVTLLVGGGFVSGTLVSRRTYLEELDAFVRSTERTPLFEYVDELRANVPAPGSTVHLKDAEVLFAAGPLRVEMKSWNGAPDRPSRLATLRVRDVQAWMFGVARPAFGPPLAHGAGEVGPGSTITALTPAAVGWRAVFDDGKGGTFSKPVACWAIIHERYEDEEGKGLLTYVAPIVPEVRANTDNGMSVASFVQNFVGVAAPEDDPEEIRKANAHVRAIEAAEEAEEQGAERGCAGKVLYLFAPRPKRPGGA